jgi:hypothetical protein
VCIFQVKSWIGELVVSVSNTQKANRASIAKIQNILEGSSYHAKVSSSPRLANGDKVTVSINDLQRTLVDLQDKQNSNTLNTTDFVALFSSLFDQEKHKHLSPVASNATNLNTQSPRSDANSGYSSDDDFVIGGNSVYSNSRQPVCEEVGSCGGVVEMEEEEASAGSGRRVNSTLSQMDANDSDNALAIVSKHPPLTSTALSGQEQLAKALDILQQVDTILEQLSMFWGNTEVVLDMLSKKGQHAEQFIKFSHNPKLHQRFKERVSEYKNFWEGVMSMCSTYLMGIVEPQDTLSRFCTPPEEVSFSSASSTTSSLSSSTSTSSTLPSTASKRQSATPATSTFMFGSGCQQPQRRNTDDSVADDPF